MYAFQIIMNVDTCFDYDSVVDDILLSEKRTAEENYKKGTEKSTENSYLQGSEIGYRKGFDIGLEIGFYAGIINGIQKLQNSKIILLSDKEILILQKLSNFIKLFPDINDLNVNILNQYNEIKGLYKKFCFNLKINNFDKSVLNFSKWNNC